LPSVIEQWCHPERSEGSGRGLVDLGFPPPGFLVAPLLGILMSRGLTPDYESGCHREEAARAASGRRGDPVVIGMASGSLRCPARLWRPGRLAMTALGSATF